MEPSPEPFSWNIVTKNIPIGMTIQTKFRRKIQKLGVHLVHFPPDGVHLQMVVEKNLKRNFYTATLTLRVPSNILHTEKSADNLLTAVDAAVDALFRELEKLKAELRREFLWKQTSHRSQLNAEREGVFSVEPLPTEAGPQAIEDMIRDLFHFHYERMLRYARREIEFHELTGALPSGAIDARELLNEVLNQALSHPEAKEDAPYELWFYILLRLGLQRCRETHAAFRPEEFVPVELEREAEPFPSEAPTAEGGSAEIIEEAIEKEAVGLKDRIPDFQRPSSDQMIERAKLLNLLRKESRRWPEMERDVFELYFLEGFEILDIAKMRGARKDDIEQSIHRIQEHLREILR